MENPVMTVAFVVAITAFFKEQFGLTGWKVMLAAFAVLLVLTYVPVVIALFPQAEPFLTPLVQLIALFLTAAGSVDFIRQLRAGK